ncbi:terminase small subunit (endogenous virus) [Clostridium phage phiCTC2B]|nr:P27 family phage terminase small subunit [Clostridium tetani]YP_009276928.1 terminase small subunit [Clostridium phage phiCT19406B]YP_009277372.1 terminase small subunit [Clostridium phage phiCTC2B]AJA42788.1 terminase small subunit [Clostridium phage phiCT19406B]AJA42984.1 terminase small subunit [Clostridium phage phiCTC2B]KGI39118.1 terminase [Clostridium tetani]KGI43687.1 terminase [Clostridium tetani]KHO31369.1 terminase [Clostridium tetani]
MARPSKSVKTMSKNLTKEEKESRLETEERLKGGVDKISPPSHLNVRQKKIFKYIVHELEVSGILGNLDIYILGTCSISIDRLQEIEKLINKDIERLLDKDLMSAKDKYTKDFFRCCNELSLSPQSRAKLGNINLQAKEQREDVLLQVLRGGSK